MLFPAALGLCRIPASAEDYPPDTTVFAGGHVTGFAGEQVAFPVDLP